MKKKWIACLLAGIMAASLTLTGCSSSSEDTSDDAEETEAEEEEEVVYKVAIVKYVDDASLDQIEAAMQEEFDLMGEELGVTFNYEDYTYNGQADSSVMNQIASDLIADEVDIIIPIATPAALIMQSATEENQIPVVFSAVTDPVGAGLVESLEEPGSNITGTSDALDTEAVLDLMFAADPDITTVGLLYDKSQDSSTAAIEEAKAYLEEKGVTVVEKTGTTTDEISLAADALIAAGCEAVFTPTDNTVMTAELTIFEKFQEAGVAHYCGADSFALNGAFCGYGVNYEELGVATADMAIEILVDGADPATLAVQTLDNGIATVNTETAEIIGLDYSMFADMCEELVETVTAESFDDVEDEDEEDAEEDSEEEDSEEEEEE